jgi:hypothetical protein
VRGNATGGEAHVLSPARARMRNVVIEALFLREDPIPM